MGTVVVAQMAVTFRVGLTVQHYCQTFAISKSRRARDHWCRVVRRLRRHRWHRRRCRINHQFTVGRVICRVTATIRNRRRHVVALPISKNTKRATAGQRTARINAPHTSRHSNVAVGRSIHYNRQRLAAAKSRRTRNQRRHVVRRLRHNRWRCRSRHIDHQFTTCAVACRVTGTVRHGRRHAVALPISKNAKRATAGQRTARINTPYTARHGNVAVGRSIHHNGQRLTAAKSRRTRNHRRHVIRRLRYNR